MANPDRILAQLPEWLLTQPTTLVNRFRSKHHDQEDRYIYVPGNSFTVPGEHPLENVDINPNLFPYKPELIEEQTYVYDGPAFAAWSAKTRQLLTKEGTFDLSEFRPRKPAGVNMSGRELMLVSDPGKVMTPDLTGFSAATTQEIPGTEPIFRHDGTTKNSAAKYKYDFDRAAKDGWGVGEPLFWAGRPEMIVQGLNQAAGATDQRPAASSDLTSRDALDQLAQATRGLLQPGKNVDQQTADNMVAFFTGKGLPVKAFTTGVGSDGGAGIGAMVEKGIVWNVKRGGICSFATLAAGLKPGVGISLNPLNFGFWWGASEEAVLKAMEGFSFYQVVGASFGLGFSVIISYTWDWLPYGLTMSAQVGAEVEVALGFGGSYTFFYDPPPTGEGLMKMPTS
jgi:hypothetical protein